MISSKDISASQRLKCSLGIFFMLGILLRDSSTLKKVLEPFSFFPSSFWLMLARTIAPFACLFSYWSSSFCKFSIIGLIFGSKFSFFSKFQSFFGLESILAFSLKRYLVYFHQSLTEKVVVICAFNKKEVFVAEENSGLHKRIIFLNLFQL